MASKFKTRRIWVSDGRYSEQSYTPQHALNILRVGPDCRHGEKFWWDMLQECFKEAHRNRDKNLFRAANRILSKHLYTYYP